MFSRIVIIIGDLVMMRRKVDNFFDWNFRQNEFKSEIFHI